MLRAPAALDPAWRFHWGLALACVLLALAGNWPGRLNIDTVTALFDATGPRGPDNWHSPTLAWVWSLPAPLLGQPTAALLIQALLFGWFAGFLPTLPQNARGRATLAGELFLRAALAGAAGYVGKDAVILLAMLIAVQLIRITPAALPGPAARVGLAIVGTLFLLAKAPDFLTLVVAVALVLPFFRPSPTRYAALVAAALVVGLLAIPLNRAVDRHVFGARDLHPDKQLVLFDLAGISVRTGGNAFAAIPGWPTATLPPPQRCFLPYMWDSFAPWAPCRGYSRAFDRTDGPATRHWLRMIGVHPLAYLGHRFTYFGWLLGSRDHATWGLGGRSTNDAADRFSMAELRHARLDTGNTRPLALWRPGRLTAPLQWLEAALFRFPKAQWCGLLACLGILLFGWLRRDAGWRVGAVVPAALGVGNAAMLLAFGVADPARYLLPTTALGYIALLAMLAPAARR